jgi:hypothetical protein
LVIISIIALKAFINIDTNYPIYKELPQLKIETSPLGYAWLKILRHNAIKKGILERTKYDYIKASINYNGQIKDASIRLKGDWIDHLINEKWSFKIKLDDALNNGIKDFQIQNPKCRWGLNEYIFHKLCNKVGILSPEYTFYQVYLNNSSLGVYAIEEIPSERMLLNQGRKKGIILKLKDDIFFENEIKPIDKRKEGIIGSAKTKLITKPKDQETEKRALNILNQYKKRDLGTYQKFNIDQMAKLYAISDLAMAHHCLAWINLRFFFNYDNNLLEPICYDAYSYQGPANWALPYIESIEKKENLDEVELITLDIFEHEQMLNKYNYYLEKYTDSSFIESFMSDIRDENSFFEKQLIIEANDYKYNKNFLHENAKRIKNHLKLINQNK